MALFSEKYGYLKPREVIIREQITEPIQNSIYNWLVRLWNNNAYYHRFDRHEIEAYVWEYFLNNRVHSFNCRDGIIRRYILSESPAWYKKLDLIEVVCQQTNQMFPAANLCIDFLNSEFERHYFAYRYIDGHIVEITSEEEIKAIEEALTTPTEGVKTHLHTALNHLSASQGKSDYRNSIKESISAVECMCRAITGENTLGKALNQMEAKGVSINSTLKSAFEKLYGYTNNPDTGVRHALMDDANAPTSAEATYMLITCSAFINYVNTKMQQTNG